jgi:hypothetical protein
VKLLTNIRPLANPKHIMSIGGFKLNKHIGDLNMRVTDVKGKVQTVVVRNVHYEPSLTYIQSRQCLRHYAFAIHLDILAHRHHTGGTSMQIRIDPHLRRLFLLFILGSNLGGGRPVRGLRGGGRRGWCEEWARSG